jgi:hypothetical protein
MSPNCPPVRSKIDKSFLVLFFKKEQKRTSFLKKRSKKLLLIRSIGWWRGADG